MTTPTTKKSFVLHLDSLDVLEELTDEQAGQLFKSIKEYAKGNPVGLSGLLNAVFIPFRNQINRDAEKYESVCNRNAENGKKGGRPKTQKTQSVILKPKKADSDNDNDSDNKKDNKDSSFELFWNSYPKKVGKGAAEKAWKKIKKPSETIGLITEAIEWQVKSEQWLKDGGQFIPNPSTYLNQRRWEDEPEREKTFDEMSDKERVAVYERMGFSPFKNKYGVDNADLTMKLRK